MGYWRPSGSGFVPGVPMTNYSDAAMTELEEANPGIKDSGAFVRVDEPMPGDEPRTTPSEVREMIEEEGAADA